MPLLLKVYEYGGNLYQFKEGQAPKGAVLFENKKASKPVNKARKAPAGKKPVKK